jgi:hypothetical protein
MITTALLDTIFFEAEGWLSSAFLATQTYQGQAVWLSPSALSQLKVTRLWWST